MKEMKLSIKATFSESQKAQIVARGDQIETIYSFEMPAGVLERNRRRGAPLAIAEAHRRACEAMHIPVDRDLDIGG